MKHEIGDMQAYSTIKGYEINKGGNEGEITVEMLNSTKHKTYYYNSDEEELNKELKEDERNLQMQMIYQENLRQCLAQDPEYIKNAKFQKKFFLGFTSMFAIETIPLLLLFANMDEEENPILKTVVGVAGVITGFATVLGAVLTKDSFSKEKEIKKANEFLSLIGLKKFSEHGTIAFDSENNPRLFDGVNYKGELNVNTLRKYSLSALKKIRENAKELSDVQTNDFSRQRVK